MNLPLNAPNCMCRKIFELGRDWGSRRHLHKVTTPLADKTAFGQTSVLVEWPATMSGLAVCRSDSGPSAAGPVAAILAAKSLNRPESGRILPDGFHSGRIEKLTLRCRRSFVNRYRCRWHFGFGRKDRWDLGRLHHRPSLDCEMIYSSSRVAPLVSSADCPMRAAGQMS